MCGIGALIASRAASVDVSALIAPFLDSVRHRGPDDEGFALADGSDAPFRSYGGRDTPETVLRQKSLRPALEPAKDTRVALGHRRLAIVDVTPAGHQPMLADDGRRAIVYNGEIYNFEQLRRELEAGGHTFRSHSDTEVVLAALDEWGPRALERFNGMFVFVVYDTRTRRVFAARDRFGVKPLYMWKGPDGIFAFASEIKQLTTLPSFRARLNAQRAYDFLNYSLADHTEETLFAGVSQLPGGTYIDCTLDDLERGMPRLTRWYDLRPGRAPARFEEAAEQVRELFFDAVRLRMRADVPIGTALSGGVDSSSIVCTVNHHLRASGAPRQQSFSACSHVPRFDERAWVERVVEATGVEPHYVYTTVEGLFEALDAMTWHQDEPFGGTSNFAEWAVFQLVAQTPVKVTLDGHGADELFAGYPSFYGAKLVELLKSGKLRELRHDVSALRSQKGWGARLIGGALLNAGMPDAYLQKLRRATGRISQEATWFRHDVLKVDPRAPHLPYFRQSQSVSGLSRTQLLATSLPQQLHWADRDSMAHSIESRTPFLDYRLVELVLGLPAESKIRNGVTKAVLRTAMRDVLPNAVANRRDKMGFMTAEEHWILREASELFRRESEAAYDAMSDIVNAGALRRSLDIIEGKQLFNLFVWRLISFARWRRRFDVEL